jgi:hypothetical protein
MPEFGMSSRESPNDTLLGQARLHVLVVGHVTVVIEVYEVMIGQLPEDRKSRQDQEHTYRKL